MNMSNEIAELLYAMLEKNGIAEIQRNDLAERLGCVPSQINYVITSRFTPERGYTVESRRGGGGYIKITRVNYTSEQMFMHIVNSIGARIDEPDARALILGANRSGAVSDAQAKIMLSAVNDRNFNSVKPEQRQAIRALLLKRMLLSCA